jgi:transposase-like protein
MVWCDMPQDAGLRRSAVVVYTADKQRIKPSCPMCGAVAWATPVPDNKGDKVFSHVIVAELDGTLSTFPVNRWLCTNCGFLWERLQVTKSEQEDASGGS